MAVLPIEAFGGVAPLIDPRKLPPQGATVASDCVFDGTDLRPLRSPVQMASIGFAPSRLFKYRFEDQGYWLAWPAPWIIDVVPSPIAQDALGRLYWSRFNPNASGPGDDNWPRVASQPTQSAITNNTAAIRRLGIPAPTIAPTITEARINATAVPVTMSQTSPVTVTTAEDHPFKEGQKVIVKFENLPADPPANMSELNGEEFTLVNVEARQFDLLGSDGANYTEFTDATGVTIERVYGESDLESRAYVYTLVSDWGEEGPPSPPSAVVDIRYDSSVDLEIPTTIASPFNTYVNRVRVYRTASGTQGAEFFFVADVPITTPGQPVEYTDAVPAIALGEVLPSTEWTMPPNGLQGLVAMPNGFLAGFKGNTLYFSEPYLPHAWPDAHRKTVTDDIVGIVVYGQTLVVATKGQPYIATGVDPSSVTTAKLDVYAPCLSKSGVCSIGSGVAYPTYDGLVVVNASGAQIVTLSLISKTQWAAMWDEGMTCAWHDGRLIAFSTNGSRPTLCFQLSRDGLNISTSTVIGTAPAPDDDDTLHFAIGSNRMRWDSGQAMTAVWQSRIFTLPSARSMGVCRVYASSYPVQVKFGYANLAQPLGQPQAPIASDFTMSAQGPEPFRLPSGFMSREWQLTITTTHAVQGVMVGEVMDEFRQ